MTMDYLSILLCVLLACVAILFLISTAKKSHGSYSYPRTLPPGPSPLPIFGNLFSLGAKTHVSLAELAKTHGPLMTLHLGQVPTVVISSAAVAKEALQKNDIPFCNRMVFDAFRALDHHQNSVVWLPQGPQWRNLRKICNSQVFSARSLEASQNLRRNKVKDLVSYVEKHCESGMPVDIGQAAFTTSLNLLSNTFFSMDMGDPSSELACEFRKVVRRMMEESGKPNMSDYIPFIRKADPQGIRRRMSVHLGKLLGLLNTIINQRLQEKNPSESVRDTDVLDALLGINQEKSEDIEPASIPNLLFDLFFTGTDTTTTTLEWALAELLHNPEKLQKAQAELREIIGKGNPVEESHIAQLPYLQAIIKETLRVHPPAPLLMRQVDSDVQLLNYTVPKNAQVITNLWAIGRDPEQWENPNTFEPERFVGSEVDFRGRDFELIPFGVGRRMCPGMPLAIRMVPLMLASLIHGFNWKLEDGVSPESLDMEEKFGLTLEKAQRLRAIPVRS